MFQSVSVILIIIAKETFFITSLLYRQKFLNRTNFKRIKLTVSDHDTGKLQEHSTFIE